MLKLHPELLLPKELDLSYPPDFFDWIKSNLAGLKYITFKKFIRTNHYEPQCCKIVVNANAQPNSIPEEKVNEILEKMFLVLQYFRDEIDSPGKYCITIYQKTTFGTDRPLAKHITIGNDTTGESEAKSFDPSKLDGNILDAQMAYVAMLQDSNCKLMSLTSELVSPIMEMNKEMQRKLIELGANQVRLKEIELIAESEKEEQKIRLLLEQAKIKGNNEKLESALKHLNKNGALDHFMHQGAAKLFGVINGTEEMKPQPKKKVTPKTPEQSSAEQKAKEKQKEEEDLRTLEEGLRVSPIFTKCVLLKNSLESEESENGNDSVNAYMKENLSVGMLKDFQDLLTSENEEDAKNNLRTLFSNLSDEDYPKLLMLRTKMNEGQQKIITSLYKFLEEENKEEDSEK